MPHSMLTSKLWLSLILCFGAFVLGVGMVRGESSLSTYMELSESQRILEATVAKLEAENASLNLEITKIRKSASYARKVLRDKYHVTDSDEHIIFIED